MQKRLLSPDPEPQGGGTPSGTPSAPPSKPIEQGQKGPLPPTNSAPNPAPPATAKAVLEGTKTERELELERKLKERETEAAQLLDENRRLKTPPQPAQREKAAEQKRSFLSGGTFFDEEEE